MVFKLSPFSFTYKKINEDDLHPRKIYSQVDINICANGLYLITGESGSGKSTFLHLLKGLAPKYIQGELDGKLLFNGSLINIDDNEEKMNEMKKEIVYLFQNPFSQLIHSSPELEFAFTMENLNFSEETYLIKKKEIEEKFKIGHLWNKKTFELSNGECQKLILASLIALAPKVILLDEPTAFLDPESRLEFYKIISELKKNHIIIMVDHHVKEINSIVDVQYFISNSGEIKITESSEQLPKLDKLDNLDHFFNVNNDRVLMNINNLAYSYSTNEILFTEVNFQFKEGDVIVIKGGNGLGKSTFLKLLTKILKPTIGKVNVLFNDKKLNSREIKEITGFVFQNPENNFFYDTLEEELDGGNDELKFKFFNKEELKRSPYLFSEGQKRRISILINLIHSKKILIYDEPTFGQDLKNKKAIEELVLGMKKAKCLQVIISHDEDFINKVATRVLTIKNKKIHEN